MQVGWKRIESAHLDDVLHVGDDELPAIKTIGDLKTLLVGKLSASGIVAYDAVLKLNCFDLNDCDELAPYVPLLEDGGLRWMLCTADVAPDDGSVPVVFKFDSSRTVMLKVHLDSPIGVTTELLRVKSNCALAPGSFVYVYGGFRFASDQSLAPLGYKLGASVDIGFSQVGGGSATMFADVSNTNAMRSVVFSSKAPSWRNVRPGLNIHGTCSTYEGCVAYNKEVISPQGFQPFNVVAQTASCPMCSREIKATSCGFYDCEWRFQGQKADSGLFMSSGWKTLADNKTYHMFDDDDSNMVLWLSLLLLVRPSKQEPTCALCQGEIAQHSRTPCGHMHRACVTTWIASCAVRRIAGADCPDCRAAIA